ncbi:MAG: OadG family protein [Kiritimatiellales bacterium]|nr:OadG family protein [Kiritimatiellales bacterium]
MAQGLVLLVIGMATVFSFLVLLVIAMQAAAAFFKKYAHLFPEEVARTSTPAVNPAAAIAVALAAIRAKRG